MSDVKRLLQALCEELHRACLADEYQKVYGRTMHGAESHLADIEAALRRLREGAPV